MEQGSQQKLHYKMNHRRKLWGIFTSLPAAIHAI